MEVYNYLDRFEQILLVQCLYSYSMDFIRTMDLNLGCMFDAYENGLISLAEDLIIINHSNVV